MAVGVGGVMVGRWNGAVACGGEEIGGEAGGSVVAGCRVDRVSGRCG